MAQLVALKSFYMSGHGDVRAGDKFTVADKHVRILKAIGRARDVSYWDDHAAAAAAQPRSQRAESAPEEEEQAPTLAASPEPVKKAVEQPKEAPEPAKDEHEMVVSALRRRAEAMGVDVDGRWGEERLRREIEDARKHRYERRDLQAKE